MKTKKIKKPVKLSSKFAVPGTFQIKSKVPMRPLPPTGIETRIRPEFAKMANRLNAKGSERRLSKEVMHSMLEVALEEASSIIVHLKRFDKLKDLLKPITSNYPIGSVEQRVGYPTTEHLRVFRLDAVFFDGKPTIQEMVFISNFGQLIVAKLVRVAVEDLRGRTFITLVCEVKFAPTYHDFIKGLTRKRAHEILEKIRSWVSLSYICHQHSLDALSKSSLFPKKV